MSSNFLSKLIVEKISEGKWKLVESLSYFSDTLNGLIIVPKGFVTDFASVPRFLPISYSILGNTEHEAAVVHDYLYQTHSCKNRKQADKIFLEAMKTLDEISNFKCRMMYFGVRIGGFFAWKTGKERFEILNNTPIMP